MLCILCGAKHVEHLRSAIYMVHYTCSPVDVMQRTWSDTCHVMWCKLCGAIDVVQLMRNNFGGAIHYAQRTLCNI
eukprot:9484213-Pyramimonas_sp.AAC.1